MKNMINLAPAGFIPPHELAGLPAHTPVLVAFSGGADSALLLHLMAAQGKASGAPVYAAHFHHGIRGEEADRDLAFCQATADRLGIPLFSKRENVPALAAASGRSLEHEARLARYAFLKSIMAEHDIPLLLTAHHADDQLETLLLRFLRGSGTRGMGGIHPIRPLGEGYVVRPLLSCTKTDILSACEKLSIPFVTDSTNASDDATRNRLRHHLIPLMAELSDHGTPADAALRLSASAREDEDLLSSLAWEALLTCAEGAGELSLQALTALHPAVGKRVLNMAFSLAQSSHVPDSDGKHSLSSLHLDSLWAWVTKLPQNGELHLPGQMRAVASSNILAFLPRQAEHIPSDNTPIPLTEGINSWDEGCMRILVRICDTEDTLAPSTDEIFAEATFPTSVLPLSVRRREAGDSIVSHGMTKKLKKLLCDRHIPQDMRDRLPLICHGTENIPLWYPTVVFADGFPPPSEGKCVKITLFYKNSPKGTRL